MLPWIYVNDIYKNYLDVEGQKHTVLNGVSLEIFPNEFLVILGKSGSGKSVLLRHIMGLECPDFGKVDYAEEFLYKGQLKQFMIGMVFQGGALFDFLTVKENVTFGLRAYNAKTQKLSEEDIEEKAMNALRDVGLEYAADFLPTKLSGGMVKRVALVRSLIYAPKLVLYDEPTAGLDPMTSQEITRLIARLRNEQSMGGVIVTHDIALTLTLADRIAIHHEGTIPRIYTKQEFMDTEEPLVEQFFCLFPNVRELRGADV
ncbi:ABC transporter ATP-binding protein [Candidatus Chlamydia sanziniae]|uniref:Methionine ABC transporter ATP-binding protein n=1 Tax=Candidatus Chlamydia sanziniae TaxID=1806891 RepID=A0A1A9HXV7_9CHLA|nr:ATP-binding cassette domain-containing protein [Candidatus Chlamydia sanziniae]ANH78922.1 Methionine ABC transporter ATP-binding protein [Candidatus Chlamydia sanziniae]